MNASPSLSKDIVRRCNTIFHGSSSIFYLKL
jgi:hypothetical protein